VTDVPTVWKPDDRSIATRASASPMPATTHSRGGSHSLVSAR
jgi:hypothetical protein